MKRFRTLSQQQLAPAAGAGVVVKPSPIQRVKIPSLLVTLTTSVAVANRQLIASICDPNGLPVFQTGSPTAIVASTSTDLVLSTAFGQPSNIQGPVNTAIGLGIPEMWLPPSWSIRVSAINLQALDQFSQINWVGDYAEDIWDQEEDQALALAFLSSITP